MHNSGKYNLLHLVLYNNIVIFAIMLMHPKYNNRNYKTVLN